MALNKGTLESGLISIYDTLYNITDGKVDFMQLQANLLTTEISKYLAQGRFETDNIGTNAKSKPVKGSGIGPLVLPGLAKFTADTLAIHKSVYNDKDSPETSQKKIAKAYADAYHTLISTGLCTVTITGGFNGTGIGKIITTPAMKTSLQNTISNLFSDTYTKQSDTQGSYKAFAKKLANAYNDYATQVQITTVDTGTDPTPVVAKGSGLFN